MIHEDLDLDRVQVRRVLTTLVERIELDPGMRKFLIRYKLPLIGGWCSQGCQEPKVPVRVRCLDGHLSDIALVERTKTASLYNFLHCDTVPLTMALLELRSRVGVVRLFVDR